MQPYVTSRLAMRSLREMFCLWVSSSDGAEIMNHLIEADAKKKSSSGTRVA